MDKAQRAAMLRARFKAKGAFGYVGTGKKRKPAREPQLWYYSPLPGIIPDTKRAPGWMREREQAETLTPARSTAQAFRRWLRSQRTTPCGYLGAPDLASDAT